MSLRGTFLHIKDLRDNPAAWRILEERARALIAPEESETRNLGEEIVIFRLGDAIYGVSAQYIREVQPLGIYTPLPFTPSFVVGLVNIRGRLFALLDIRPLLDLSPAPPQPSAFLLVLTANGTEVALLADSVSEVRHAEDVLAPLPSTTAGRGVAWVRGVDRRLTVMLDPPTLLADPRLVISGE
jgi:purine-binding chemotaxis protein CheW